MIKVTIITVCYNEKDELKKTIESVCEQTYPNIEYLVIDGASIDGTIDLLQKYYKSDQLVFYSEKDYGIYNAMNRGIARAGGDYVYFINCGDIFYNEHVIDDVVSHINNNLGAIYYGKVCLVYPDSLKTIHDFEKIEGTLHEKILNGCMPCHQAIFAPRKLLQDHYFREQFKIRADYEWWMYSISKGVECISIPVTISYYDVTGVSGRIKYNYLFQEEENKIIDEYKYIFTREETSIWQEKIKQDKKKEWLKYTHMFQLMNQWLVLKQKGKSIGAFLSQKSYQNIAIYGMGHMGFRLLDEIKDYGIKVKYAVDQNANNLSTELKVIFPDEVLEEVDVMIVTAITSYNEIEKYLKKKVRFPIISLEDIIYEMD